MNHPPKPVLTLQNPLASLLNLVLLCLFAFSPLAMAHDHGAYQHDSGYRSWQANWMAGIPGSKRLADLSLPGTHDSMAFYGGDAVQTQSMSLNDQLMAGVRVLDIRCRSIDNKFAIHHGFVYQHANFDDVLTTVKNFLIAHPGETVLMRVKEEYDASNSSLTFGQIFNNYANDPAYADFFWKGSDANVTLGDARRKIVVLANAGGFNFGIGWGGLNIQDNYNLTTNWDLYGKWESVRNMLNTANASSAGTRGFHVNFLSGSGGSFPYFVASGHSSPGTGAPRLATGLTTPGWNSSYPDFPRVDCFIGICTIAFEGTNVLTADNINAYGFGFVGIIMADFPGAGLIDKVINLNAAGIVVYADAAYSGKAQRFDLPGFSPAFYNVDSLKGVGNDTISSMTLPAGYRAIGFEHGNFEGRIGIMNGNIVDFGWFNDTVSSLILQRTDTVVLFEHSGFRGNYQALTPGFYDIGSLNIGNDVVSSILVPPGMPVTVYQHAGAGGTAVTRDGDIVNMGDIGMNDALSSIRVEKIY